MKKVAIATLGCKVNQFESASFASGFTELQCDLVPFSQPADIYVINTCAVTARAGQQSRQLIRRAMRANPEARLVITGCYAQVSAYDILEIVDNPVCIIGNGNKHLLVEKALSKTQFDLEMLMSDIGQKREVCLLPVRRFPGRTRAFLRIQDGCNNFCSYCIVPYTRGRSRSLPLQDVLDQAAVFHEQGYMEIVVTGINVGKYGLDRRENMTIYSLLDRLCTEFPDMRIRLSSVEPTEVNALLLDLAGKNSNFMPHFHVPLQSGDDTILQRMNRRYSAADFCRAIQSINQALPEAAIGCDVLAGFPGEDEQAHCNTYDLLADLPISYLHVFPYSKRPGTRAAEMGGHLPKNIKDERVSRLRTLSIAKKREFYTSRQGKLHRVLVERRNKNNLLQGFTENYLPVQCNGPEKYLQRVVPVRITKIVDEEVFGTLEIDQ